MYIHLSLTISYYIINIYINVALVSFIYGFKFFPLSFLYKLFFLYSSWYFLSLLSLPHYLGFSGYFNNSVIKFYIQFIVVNIFFIMSFHSFLSVSLPLSLYSFIRLYTNSFNVPCKKFPSLFLLFYSSFRSLCDNTQTWRDFSTLNFMLLALCVRTSMMFFHYLFCRC